MVPVGVKSVLYEKGSQLRISCAAMTALLGGLPEQTANMTFGVILNGQPIPGVYQAQLRVSGIEQGYFSYVTPALPAYVEGAYFVGVAPTVIGIKCPTPHSNCYYTHLAESRQFVFCFQSMMLNPENSVKTSSNDPYGEYD